ncbi:hypothetical protein BD770DRAFT_405976 [Pilaira anomala]|nr:hypothetical protein BD770DRAFT_405976 [Pilaira anomala]
MCRDIIRNLEKYLLPTKSNRSISMSTHLVALKSTKFYPNIYKLGIPWDLISGDENELKYIVRKFPNLQYLKIKPSDFVILWDQILFLKERNVSKTTEIRYV